MHTSYGDSIRDRHTYPLMLLVASTSVGATGVLNHPKRRPGEYRKPALAGPPVLAPGRNQDLDLGFETIPGESLCQLLASLSQQFRHRLGLGHDGEEIRIPRPTRYHVLVQMCRNPGSRHAALIHP